MSFDFSTLVTDRTQADVQLVQELQALGWAGMAAEQQAQWAAGLKGAYNVTDLNRVTACVDYLAEVLQGLGYALPGYQKILISRDQYSLPEGYTELEYIQSSGSQYINTGINPTNNTSIYIHIEGMSASTVAIFGARTPEGTPSFSAWSLNNDIRFDCADEQTLTAESFNGQDLEIIMSNGSGIINGESYAIGSGTFSIEYPLLLLANYKSRGIDSRFGEGKLKETIIYSSEEPVMHLVPCKNPSGTVGLYDVIGLSFLGNSGSGVFTAGTPVPNPPPLDPYTWYLTDIPTLSQMQQYLGNVQALRDAFITAEFPIALPTSMAQLTYVGANTIEEMLNFLNDTILRMISTFVACGPATCGGDYL